MTGTPVVAIYAALVATIALLWNVGRDIGLPRFGVERPAAVPAMVAAWCGSVLEVAQTVVEASVGSVLLGFTSRITSI
jgi:hypothetical protein